MRKTKNSTSPFKLFKAENSVIKREVSFRHENLLYEQVYNYNHPPFDSTVLSINHERGDTVADLFLLENTRRTPLNVICLDNFKDTIRILRYCKERDSSVTEYYNFIEGKRGRVQRSVEFDFYKADTLIRTYLSYGQRVPFLPGSKIIEKFVGDNIIYEKSIDIYGTKEFLNLETLYDYGPCGIKSKKSLNNGGVISRERQYFYSPECLLDSIIYKHSNGDLLGSKRLTYCDGKINGIEIHDQNGQFNVEFKYDNQGIIENEIIYFFDDPQNPRKVVYNYIFQK